MAKCISNLKKTKLQKGASLGLKCVRMRLAAGLCPDPLGKLERSPDPLAAIGGGCLLLKEREGKEMGKGKEGDGKEEGRKGREERERADPRPGLRKCKDGNPNVWGPPTTPVRGPWSKKFENRCRIVSYVIV